jgi:hypothetical protein
VQLIAAGGDRLGHGAVRIKRHQIGQWLVLELIHHVDVGGDVGLPDRIDVVIVSGDVEHFQRAAMADEGAAQFGIERCHAAGQQAFDQFEVPGQRVVGIAAIVCNRGFVQQAVVA